MRSRDVVGKTVARVVQERVTTNTGPAWDVQQIVFTDGTILYFTVVEGEDDYAIEADVMKPGRGGVVKPGRPKRNSG